MKVEVTKTHIFKGEGKALRFIESTKESPQNRFTCSCCSEKVSERPTSRLLSTSVVIEAFDKVGIYDVEVQLDKRAYSYVIRWDDFHAYFTFPVSKKPYNDYHCRFGIYCKDYGYVDYFMGNVFKGRHVDVTTLMNGHSPSRIINLNEIQEDDIWVHDCSWGKEAIKFFDNGEEKQKWTSLFKFHEYRYELHRFRPEAEFTIHEIQELVTDCKDTLARISENVEYFISIIENLKSTELFKLQSEIHSEIR